MRPGFSLDFWQKLSGATNGATSTRPERLPLSLASIWRPISTTASPQSKPTVSGVFIDRQGKLAIDQQFDSARPFSNGLAAVKERVKWGFINRRGKYVIDPEFDNAGVFSEGWGPVQNAGKAFYIDSCRIDMTWCTVSDTLH